MSNTDANATSKTFAPRGSASRTDVLIRDDVRVRDREEVRSLVECTGFFRRDEIDVAVELVDEHLARGSMSGYYFCFVEIGGKLTAYACYGPVACTVASFDLYWIAVSPRFQREGLGRTLIEKVEERIRAAGGERVYVDTSGKAQYAPTRAFYERVGFTCEATLRDFYAPGDDRVIYCKVIGSVSAACNPK